MNVVYIIDFKGQKILTPYGAPGLRCPLPPNLEPTYLQQRVAVSQPTPSPARRSALAYRGNVQRLVATPEFTVPGLRTRGGGWGEGAEGAAGLGAWRGGATPWQRPRIAAEGKLAASEIGRNMALVNHRRITGRLADSSWPPKFPVIPGFSSLPPIRCARREPSPHAAVGSLRHCAMRCLHMATPQPAERTICCCARIQIP
jgi:hypothetical protein